MAETNEAIGTIAGELTRVATEHGYEGPQDLTIAGAIDALADTLAGENVDSGQTIAQAVRALAPYVGSGGGSGLVVNLQRRYVEEAGEWYWYPDKTYEEVKAAYDAGAPIQFVAYDSMYGVPCQTSWEWSDYDDAFVFTVAFTGEYGGLSVTSYWYGSDGEVYFKSKSTYPKAPDDEYRIVAYSLSEVPVSGNDVPSLDELIVKRLLVGNATVIGFGDGYIVPGAISGGVRVRASLSNVASAYLCTTKWANNKKVWDSVTSWSGYSYDQDGGELDFVMPTVNDSKTNLYLVVGEQS